VRHVGVREFKDQATTMLASGETLVIERHGTPIGFYIPIEAKDRTSGTEALARLGGTVSEVLVAAGLSEDELVDEVVATRGRRRRR
jgi:antitoxin (DNA-binding transcriptional repressor) of toxin-antitoxin stability system